MTKSYCESCKNEFYINLEKYDENLHIILCKKCRNIKPVYIKSHCKNNFLLRDNDLKNVKYIYGLANKCYLRDDINNIVLNKYGSINNFLKYVDIYNKKNEQRKLKKEEIKNERRKYIQNLFVENKLEYNEIGDIFMFIETGKPSPIDIINNEIIKLDEEMTRRVQLSMHLNELGLYYDELFKPCENYIKHKKGSMCNITENIKFNTFLKNNTEYTKLLDDHSENSAEELAIMKFVDKNKKKRSKQKIKNIKSCAFLDFNS
jgi:hypothetical protein